MIDRNKVQLVRSVVHHVFGVDVAHRGNSPAVAHPRYVAMMTLHDEFGFKKSEAATAFGMVPSIFKHARLKLTGLVESDDAFRAKAARFYQVLDREIAARRQLEAAQ